MTLMVLATGTVGILFLASALPPFRTRGMKVRVEPFLHGLAGKTSRLLVRPGRRSPRWFTDALSAAGLLGSSELLVRLDRSGREPDEIGFRIEQLAWGAGAFLGALVVLVVAGFTGPFFVSPPALAAACVAGASGFLARDWYLSKEIERRHQILKEQLPTALDHLTLALMAGESIAGAIERVKDSASGVVAEELGRVSSDIRGGATVIEALDNFRARAPGGSIGRFVDALCVAMERGTSLTDVLRAQADDAREAKRRHLLELGGRREVLMLVPVVFLIMPVVVLFALYPGLVSLDLLVP